MRTIDYYYSTRSNFTLLGAARLNELARRFNRRIVHRPILLSIVMPPIGGQLFGERPPLRTHYSMIDALRCAAHLGIPLLREPVHHNGPVELPSGIVIAAQRAVNRGEAGDVDALSLAVLSALWIDDRDIADRSVIGPLCAAAGFADPEALMNEAVDAPVQAELARNCREAIIRGVLGAPTYFVDEEHFYGQDRLDYVERKLSGIA